MKSKLILVALAGTLFTVVAVAQTAVEWGGTESSVGSGPTYTAGYRFRVTAASDVEVHALGVYDAAGNGLNRTHTVAIWPVTGGIPLVTADVPSGSVAVLEGHFRYVNITPVRLFKDTEYVVGASDFGGSGDTNDAYAIQSALQTTNSVYIEFLARRLLLGFGLSFPTLETPAVPSRGFFGGNFKLNPLPHTTIRLSQVEVCWTSETNKQYQVEYKSALTTNAWLTFGSPMPGTGTNNCILAPVPPSEPQRFYRVLALP